MDNTVIRIPPPCSAFWENSWAFPTFGSPSPTTAEATVTVPHDLLLGCIPMFCKSLNLKLVIFGTVNLPSKPSKFGRQKQTAIPM